MLEQQVEMHAELKSAEIGIFAWQNDKGQS